MMDGWMDGWMNVGSVDAFQQIKLKFLFISKIFTNLDQYFLFGIHILCAMKDKLNK